MRTPRSLRLLAVSAALSLGLIAGELAGPATAAPASGPGISLHRDLLRHPGRGGYTIDLAEPQLVGGWPGQSRINAQLTAAARYEIESFLIEVRRDEIPPSLPTPVATSVLDGTATTDVDTPGLVGFTTDVYDQWAGAAHGITAVSTYDFDPRTGRRLALSQLFRPGSRWLALLSRESRRLLPAVLGELANPTMMNPGTTPKASNFEGWSLTPFGLVLTFGNYQVAAYAAGTPTILVPFSALRRVGSPFLLAWRHRPETAMALLPARTPPVSPECYVTLRLSFTAVPRPLTCDQGRVNEAAWTVFASNGLRVLSAGRAATPAGVERAMCLDQWLEDPAYVVGAEALASVYYGWRFGTAPAVGYPRSCSRLG